MGWITALKLVPWSEVIAAAPSIVQAARKLIGRTKAAPVPLAQEDIGSDGIAALRERIEQLAQEQRESAVLIQTLAEQNAQIIGTVEALRMRNQRLVACIVCVGVAALGTLSWLLMHS